MENNIYSEERKKLQKEHLLEQYIKFKIFQLRKIMVGGLSKCIFQKSRIAIACIFCSNCNESTNQMILS